MHCSPREEKLNFYFLIQVYLISLCSRNNYRLIIWLLSELVVNQNQTGNWTIWWKKLFNGSSLEFDKMHFYQAQLEEVAFPPTEKKCIIFKDCILKLEIYLLVTCKNKMSLPIANKVKLKEGVWRIRASIPVPPAC